MKPSLKKILDYQNENVISRFVDKYDVTEQEANELFTETKKFLYLSHFERVFITNDILIIDEMWHNFVLFTSDYQKFCDTYFGHFKHHKPSTKAEKEERELKKVENKELVQKEFLENIEWLMSVTYDRLGHETVEKWFEKFPETYSAKQIKALTK